MTHHDFLLPKPSANDKMKLWHNLPEKRSKMDMSNFKNNLDIGFKCLSSSLHNEF